MRLLLGLATELRPKPVIATLIAVYSAFLLAKTPMTLEVPLFLISIFFLLYTVHFLDTHEDYFIRKEDDFKTFTFAHGSSGLLKKEELVAGAAICSVIFFAITIYLSLHAGLILLLLNIAAYLIGISYSRYLSRNWMLSILAAPAASVVAMVGGYLLAAGVVDLKILAYSIPVFLLFLGAMTWMEIADSDTDRKSGRPNAGLVLGIERAKWLGFAFLLGGLAIALIRSFSILLLLSTGVCLVVFYRGFSLKPQSGIQYIMGGILAFLVIEVLYLATA